MWTPDLNMSAHELCIDMMKYQGKTFRGDDGKVYVYRSICLTNDPNGELRVECDTSPREPHEVGRYPDPEESP